MEAKISLGISCWPAQNSAQELRYEALHLMLGASLDGNRAERLLVASAAWSSDMGMPVSSGRDELHQIGEVVFCSVAYGDSCHLREERILLGADEFDSVEALVAYWTTDIVALPGFAALSLEQLDVDALTGAQHRLWLSALDHAETKVTFSDRGQAGTDALREKLGETNIYQRVRDALEAPNAPGGARLLAVLQGAGAGGSYHWLEAGQWDLVATGLHRVGVREVRYARGGDFIQGYLVDLGPTSLYVKADGSAAVLGQIGQWEAGLDLGESLALTAVPDGPRALIALFERQLSDGRPIRPSWHGLA